VTTISNNTCWANNGLGNTQEVRQELQYQRILVEPGVTWGKITQEVSQEWLWSPRIHVELEVVRNVGFL